MIWLLSIVVRLLPIEQTSVFLSDIFLSEKASDAVESEDKECEVLARSRHSDMQAFCRYTFLLSLDGIPLGDYAAHLMRDRGADDIPTPPPNARG